MKIYEQSDGYGFEDLSQNGIWQAFTFGPSLLDRNGNPKKNYNIAASHLSDLSYSHPRRPSAWWPPDILSLCWWTAGK